MFSLSHPCRHWNPFPRQGEELSTFIPRAGFMVSFRQVEVSFLVEARIPQHRHSHPSPIFRLPPAAISFRFENPASSSGYRYKFFASFSIPILFLPPTHQTSPASAGIDQPSGFSSPATLIHRPLHSSTTFPTASRLEGKCWYLLILFLLLFYTLPSPPANCNEILQTTSCGCFSRQSATSTFFLVPFSQTPLRASPR